MYAMAQWHAIYKSWIKYNQTREKSTTKGDWILFCELPMNEWMNVCEYDLYISHWISIIFNSEYFHRFSLALSIPFFLHFDTSIWLAGWLVGWFVSWIQCAHYTYYSWLVYKTRLNHYEPQSSMQHILFIFHFIEYNIYGYSCYYIFILISFHFWRKKIVKYKLQGKQGIDLKIFCWMAFISQFACICIAHIHAAIPPVE